MYSTGRFVLALLSVKLFFDTFSIEKVLLTQNRKACKDQSNAPDHTNGLNTELNDLRKLFV